MREEIDELYRLLRTAGAEERKSQKGMSYHVADTIEGEKHTYIEAPPGIGKTIALLVPAIIWSLKNNRSVAISTATKALQDQVVANDFPRVAHQARKILGRAPKLAVLKGRMNYVSKERYRDFVTFSLQKDLDDKDIADISQWMETTETGDLGEILLPEFIPQTSVCVPEKGRDEDCFYQRAIENARDADIIVTNHHAVLSRFRESTQKLERSPAFEALNIRNIIFDEAHSVEDTALNLFTTRMSFF